MQKVEDMYWETYDDQDSADFDLVGYEDLSGTAVLVPVESNLAIQVAEIKRLNGESTEIKVYKQ